MSGLLHDMQWVHAIRSEALTPVFRALSAAGNAGFWLLFLPLGYWLWSRRVFSRLGLLLLVSALLNGWLKAWFEDPRPGPSIAIDGGAHDSFGFPSGHAQMAVAVWSWLAVELRRASAWIVCALLATGVAFSRLYLGLHDVEDVLGGAALGAMTAGALALAVASRRLRPWREGAAGPQLAAIALAVATAVATWPGDGAGFGLRMGGCLLGFWWGVRLDERRRGSAGATGPGRAALAVAVGLAGLALLRAFPGAGGAAGPVADGVEAVRYALLGWWLADGAPRAFAALGLDRRGGLPPPA